MKAKKFRELTGRFLLNELGDPHFFNTQIQIAHGRVQYITISRKVKNSALRYFYLNAEKNMSLGTTGYVRTQQILHFFFSYP